MKFPTIACAVMLLSAPMAFAQTSTTPGTGQSSGTGQTPGQTTAPGSATTQQTGQPQFYNHQAGEMRASKLIGATVRNDANENVGEINEVILGQDGRIAAVVIGVGGFLGVGEREAAVDYKSLRIERDPSAMTESGATIVKLNATKDSLKSAPQWSWNSSNNTQRQQ